MSNTNGRYLDGQEFKGNVSILPNCDDDGSLEAAGILFVNEIREYNIESQGVTIEGSIFYSSGNAIITSTQNAVSTTASLIVNGGVLVNKDSIFNGIIYLYNTSNSNNLSSGALQINGGVSINNNVSLGGIMTIFNSTSSINSSVGSFISLGGISIQNTTDATGFSNGGALTILGGATVKQTLYANLFNSNNSIILNASISNLYNNNSTISNANITYLNTTSLLSNNSLLTNTTVTNILINNASVTNLYTSFNYSTNAIINYLTASIGNFQNITSSTGNIQTLTVGSLYVINDIQYNTFIINLSTSNILSSFASIGSLNAFYTTMGSSFINYANITNLLNTNNTIQNLFNNYSTIQNLINVNQTISNSIITNSTITNLLSNNISSTFISTNNLNTTYATFQNLTITQIIPSYNSTIGSIVLQGGLSINNTTNAQSITSGGGITNAGGLAIAKDVYIGGILNSQNIISNNITSNSLYISSTQNSNSLSAALFSIGGITIVSTTDTTSITSGGGFTNLGGASIAKSLFVGGTISTLSLSTYNFLAENEIITNSTIANITNNNLVSININTTNITNANLLSQNITCQNINIVNVSASNIITSNILTSNIITSNILSNNSTITNVNASNLTSSNILTSNILLTSGTFTNLIGNNITSTYITDVYLTSVYSSIANLSNNYSSIGSLQLFNGTFGNLFGTNLLLFNASIGSLSATNTHVINISTSNIISNFSTIGNLYINDNLPSYNSTTASVIFNGGLSIKTTTNASSISSGGGITNAGGLAISKNVYIGGNTYMIGSLDLNNNIITNVTAPSSNLQVANKWYVDNIFYNFTSANIYGNFTQGQVIIAGTNGNAVGYPNFIFDGVLLSIYSTVDATSLSNGGSLTVYGGASIDKQLFVGSNAHILGYLDMNNQKITSVAIPTTPYDAANKYYVDYKFNNFTSGSNISGNFTQGQVIVAGTNGNVIGYPNFIFDGTQLSIKSTTNSLGLGSGGTLTINGGASILNNVYIGNGLDLNNTIITNVASPINSLDAVNKQYVDFFLGINTGDIKESAFILTNNQILPANVTGFIFDNSTVSSFNALVYLQIPTLNKYDQWEIRGLLKGSTWIITTDFIGDHPNKVSFSIVTSGGFGQIQYTNGNLVGIATLRFRASTTSQGVYTNITTTNLMHGVPNGGTGADFFTQGCLLYGNNTNSLLTDINLIYKNEILYLSNTNISTNLTSGGALQIAGGVNIQKNLYIGTGLDLNNNVINNVALPINSLDAVNKQYVDFFLGISTGDISESTFILANNQISPANVTGFIFNNSTVSSFNALVYLQIPTLNKYDQWEIRGLLKGSTWIITTDFIGDHPNKVSFSIVTSGGFGQIQYTNGNLVGIATLRFRASTTSQGVYTNITTTNLMHGVPNGGTGADFFTQGCLLYGNNTNSLLTDINLIYKNEILYLSNTNISTNLTSGGALQIAGGVNIQKNLSIGTGLDLNNNIINNVALPINSLDAVNKQYVDFFLGISTGDIKESTFILTNNQILPANVNGFAFDNSIVSSFNALVYLQIPTLNKYDQWEIRGLLKGSTWIITTDFIGDHPNKVSFSIVTSGGFGQIQYTNGNLVGIATLRFRASTTSQGVYTNITTTNLMHGVPNGGTGADFFTQGCLLYGNNTNSLLTDINLIYKNEILYLSNTNISTNLTSGGALQIAGGVNIQKNLYIGTGLDLNNNVISNVTAPSLNLDVANKWYVDSKFGSGGSLNLSGSVNFTNTTDALNSTMGGALTIFGGAGIAKKLYVGSQLFVKNINMTPSLGDIFYEQSFSANNNQSTPANIINFMFNNFDVRYFQAMVSICITTTTSKIISGCEIKGIQLDGPIWQINTSFIGNNPKIVFNITNTGQITYTSSNIINFISTIIKFRCMTTSV